MHASTARLARPLACLLSLAAFASSSRAHAAAASPSTAEDAATPESVAVGDAGPSLLFTRDGSASGVGPVDALAFDPELGRLAIGGPRGAWLREADGRLRSVLHRDSVTALAFGEAGALWIGTPNGLRFASPEGRIEERSPAAGEAARAVTAVATLRGVVAVATADGVHVSRDGRRWQRVEGGLPAAAADALALRPRGDAVELWTDPRGELWRLRLRRTEEGFAVESAAAEAPWAAGGRGPVLQIALDPVGADAVALAAGALALRRSEDGPWEVLRPGLAPGVAMRHVAYAARRWWIASDRGLFESATPVGPWRRASSPAGAEPAVALAGDPRGLFAGGPGGLLEGRFPPEPAVARADALPAPFGADDPPIEQVHRAALAYLDLGPERMRRLHRGVAWRGLLPVVSLDLVNRRSFDSSAGADESFVSGATRRLHDRSRDRGHDTGGTLSFAWDLGDAAYHPEEIDLSKESREVIELRDDVLDEITQLYFERRRVLLDLAALAPDRAGEAARLRLRADELAAGLDAWTGGWFSRRVPRLAP